MLLDILPNINNPISIWTIFASIAAIVSSISAYRNSKFAQKNYVDKQSNFSLYIIKSFRWSSVIDSKQKFLLFNVEISNKSESKNSYKSELEIEYFRKNESRGKLKLPHNESLSKNIIKPELIFFPNEIRVDERGIQSKWLIFEQPQGFFKKNRILEYSIELTDTHGKTKIARILIMNEINENFPN